MLHGYAGVQKDAFISSRNAARNFVPAVVDVSTPKPLPFLDTRHAFKEHGLASRPKRRVLIVGDSSGVCTALARGLRRPELDVQTATGAASGIEILGRESVDYVIAELSLPPTGGIDFLEVARRLRPACNRVLITGECDIAVIRDAIKRSDVCYFLGKPWDAHSLHELVREVLLTDASPSSQMTPATLQAIDLDSEFRARSVSEGLQLSPDLTCPAVAVAQPGYHVGIPSRLAIPVVSSSSRSQQHEVTSGLEDEPAQAKRAEKLELNQLARDLLGASDIQYPRTAKQD